MQLRERAMTLAKSGRRWTEILVEHETARLNAESCLSLLRYLSHSLAAVAKRQSKAFCTLCI